eukprot:365725-Chlamydomonas_euryale.AAC.13
MGQHGDGERATAVCMCILEKGGEVAGSIANRKARGKFEAMQFGWASVPFTVAVRRVRFCLQTKEEKWSSWNATSGINPHAKELYPPPCYCVEERGCMCIIVVAVVVVVVTAWGWVGCTPLGPESAFTNIHWDVQ